MTNNNFHFPPDESLHSYLFRMLKVNGFNNYSSILVPHIGWRDSPSIPYEAIGILKGVNKSRLLKLIESSTHISTKESEFVNHFDYVTLFKRTFSPPTSTKLVGKGLKINFCPFCIKEQIREYGYSYFKNSWTKYTYCLKHYLLLLTLKPFNQSTMVKNIQKVLKGELDDSFISPCATSKPKASPLTISDRFVKFAPCSKLQLIKWITKHENYYPQGYTDTFDYGLLNKNKRSAFNLRKYRDEVEKNWDNFYQDITEYAHNELMGFINENMVFDLAQYNEQGISSDPKVILKDLFKNCNTCARLSNDEYKACAKNKTIYISESMSTFEKQRLESCYFRHIDLEIDIDEYQNRLGIRKGEIEVQKQIEMSNEYKKFGGKELYITRMMKIARKSRFSIKQIK